MSYVCVRLGLMWSERLSAFCCFILVISRVLVSENACCVFYFLSMLWRCEAGAQPETGRMADQQNSSTIADQARAADTERRQHYCSTSRALPSTGCRCLTCTMAGICMRVRDLQVFANQLFEQCQDIEQLIKSCDRVSTGHSLSGRESRVPRKATKGRWDRGDFSPFF